MSFFESKLLKTTQRQRDLISQIILEYTNAFSTPLDDIYTNKLFAKSDALIGSQQLLKQYLCELLIIFLRESSKTYNQYKTISTSNNSTLNILINYMKDNITKKLTIEDLVKYSATNRMTINRLFNNNLKTTPIKYFATLKIDAAKKHLREDTYNISQIAELLGYSSVHYFSLQFKKFTDMTPSEYHASIKSMLETSHGESKTKNENDI